jgi:two-component system OmpR family sensor kinase
LPNSPASSLIIRDKGPGIAPDQRARVLEPFFRVPGSEQAGSGLGLSIVAEIARSMWAALRLDWTDSVARQGLQVTVHFPAAATWMAGDGAPL